MSTERSIRIYFTAPNISIGVINILVNSFLIYSIWRLKKLQTISYKLVVVLSVSDILIGCGLLITEPMFLFAKQDGDIFNVRLVTGIFLYTFCQFSGFMIVAIAIDRFIHMRYSASYSAIVTKRRAVISVIGIFSFSIALTAAFVCSLKYKIVFAYYLSLSIITLVSFIVLSALYSAAYISMQKRTAVVPERRGRLSIAVNRNSSQEFYTAVVFILSSLWICYTPFVIFSALKYKDTNVERFVLIGFFISEVLVYANATINAIVFISFNNHLKSYARNRLRCLENR